MSDDSQARADARLDQAIAARGARDPREYYRQRLRALKEQDGDAYALAVAHYREVLVPAIAQEGADALATWTEYGRRLAELSAPGRTVALDGTGRAWPYESPADPDHLVLHLAEGRRPNLLVALPTEPTPAQRAAYDWLIDGRTSLRDAS
jgi:hypothetical protein